MKGQPNQMNTTINLYICALSRKQGIDFMNLYFIFNKTKNLLHKGK